MNPLYVVVLWTFQLLNDINDKDRGNLPQDDSDGFPKKTDA